MIPMAMFVGLVLVTTIVLLPAVRLATGPISMPVRMSVCVNAFRLRAVRFGGETNDVVVLMSVDLSNRPAIRSWVRNSFRWLCHLDTSVRAAPTASEDKKRLLRSEAVSA